MITQHAAGRNGIAGEDRVTANGLVILCWVLSTACTDTEPPTEYQYTPKQLAAIHAGKVAHAHAVCGIPMEGFVKGQELVVTTYRKDLLWAKVTACDAEGETLSIEVTLTDCLPYDSRCESDLILKCHPSFQEPIWVELHSDGHLIAQTPPWHIPTDKDRRRHELEKELQELKNE